MILRDGLINDDKNNQEDDPSAQKLRKEKFKETPDEENPSLLGTPPDIFNVPKHGKPEPIKPVTDEEDLLDDEPKPEDGLI